MKTWWIVPAEYEPYTCTACQHSFASACAHWVEEDMVARRVCAECFTEMTGVQAGSQARKF